MSWLSQSQLAGGLLSTSWRKWRYERPFLQKGLPLLQPPLRQRRRNTPPTRVTPTLKMAVLYTHSSLLGQITNFLHAAVKSVGQSKKNSLRLNLFLQTFITVFTTAHNWFISWYAWIYSKPSLPITLYTLILSLHCCLVLPGRQFRLFFTSHLCMALSYVSHPNTSRRYVYTYSTVQYIASAGRVSIRRSFGWLEDGPQSWYRNFLLRLFHVSVSFAMRTKYPSRSVFVLLLISVDISLTRPFLLTSHISKP